MPVYVYRCDNCKADFEVRHGMFFEDQRCIICNSKDFVSKVPDLSFIKINKINKPGKVVEDFIVDAREDLRKQKEDIKKKN